MYLLMGACPTFDVDHLTPTLHKSNLDSSLPTAWRERLSHSQRSDRVRNDRHLSARRGFRHEQADRLAKPFAKPGYLTGVFRVDDAALALCRQGLPLDLGDDVAQT